MKKIIFLQSKGNALGGVWFVNRSIGEALLAYGYDVTILNIRNEQGVDPLEYDKRMKMFTINEKDIWGIKPYSYGVSLIRHFHIVQGIHSIFLTWKRRKGLYADYEKAKQFIRDANPECIITTHYQVLDAVPEEFLSRTIHEQHTSFQITSAHKGTMKVLQEYNGKVHYLWLTKATCESARKAGLKKNYFMYNPLRFENDEISDVITHKTLVTVARLDTEKRLHLMIDAVKEIFKDKKFQTWKFLIYGDGELLDELKQQAKDCKQIIFMGNTDNPKGAFLKSSINLCTSEFEGFPLSIIEAYACGVPTVSVNFGEAAYEVIQQQKTGIVVGHDDMDAFIHNVRTLMEDETMLRNLSENAFAYAKQFYIENVVQKWIQLFDEIAS